MPTRHPEPPPPTTAETPVVTPPPPSPPALTDRVLTGEPGPRRKRTALERLSPRVLASTITVGFVGNLAMRLGGASLAAALSIVATALLLVGPSAEQSASASSRVAAAAAAFFGLLLPLRASSWLFFLNSTVAVACLIASAILRTNPRTRFTVGSLGRIARQLLAGFEAPAVVLRSVRPSQDGWADRLLPVIRGLVVAIGPLLILGALLVSADAVFADALAVEVGLDTALGHAALTVFCAAMIVALLAVGAASVPEDERDPEPWLGNVEWSIVLGSVALLFGAFAGIQLVGALGMADDALARQGLTPAEYARSGYFQLLWVAALTAVLLLAVRLATVGGSARGDWGARVVRMLGATVCVLTVLIVASAIVRLGLYTDAFGQTTLRWYSGAFAWLLGAGFVAAAFAHWGRLARLLPRVLMGLTAGTLIACVWMNPEARVARHNLEHGPTPEAPQIDADYLARLSADAWPTLLRHRSALVPELGSTGLRESCHAAKPSSGWGPFGFNLAVARLDCSSIR